MNAPCIADAEVNEDELTVHLEDGRSVTTPLEWYPRLAFATLEERQNFEITGRGRGLLADVGRGSVRERNAIGHALRRRGAKPQSLFGKTLTACDCVVLVQNGFCIRPVVPLQGLIWAPFCSFAHCVSASHSLTKQALKGWKEALKERRRLRNQGEEPPPWGTGKYRIPYSDFLDDTDDNSQ